jgi:hypothetical protein
MTTPVDLTKHANQFDEIEVEERTPIIDLNAINPLSELRDEWQNVSNNQTEYNLNTSANTNDTAYLETVERGQYTPGYQAQIGQGVRIPEKPTGDSKMRWGYYTVDANGDPVNGYYYGVDSTGLFVGKARGGDIKKVYQDSWNRDQLDGTGGGSGGPNPSELVLDLSDGHVFQIEFVYYGYGGIEMQILFDSEDTNAQAVSELVTAHVFQPEAETSIKNTNLPLRQEIVSGGTNNDALDLYTSGRQFSIIGKESTNSRRNGHYRETMAGIDDTKWYAAMSFNIKDGTDIGAIDFGHVIANTVSFTSNPDSTGYRWAVRRGTTPDNPIWENPSSAEDKQDETALKVDVNSADVQDESGNLTGVSIDSGTLAAGEKNKITPNSQGAVGQLNNGEVVTLLFKAVPGGIGDIQDIHFKLDESW